MRPAHSSRFECYKPSLFDRTATPEKGRDIPMISLAAKSKRKPA